MYFYYLIKMKVSIVGILHMCKYKCTTLYFF